MIKETNEMSKLSDEEENYLQLIRLVNTFATMAMRDKFNQYFPPPKLPRMLKNEQSRLKKIRVLNAMQWSLTYPATGMCYTSLRNKSTIRYYRIFILLKEVSGIIY